MSQSAAEVLVRMEPGLRPDVDLIKTRHDEQFGVGALQAPRVIAEMLASWYERPRFLAALFGALAAIALSLAAIGVFAVAGSAIGLLAAWRAAQFVQSLVVGIDVRDPARFVAVALLLAGVAAAAAGLAMRRALRVPPAMCFVRRRTDAGLCWVRTQFERVLIRCLTSAGMWQDPS